MKSNWIVAGFVIFSLQFFGCQPETVVEKSATQFQSQPLTTLTAEQEKQKRLALSVRDDLFSSLLTELMTAMSENGPVKSIKVCKLRAPEVAKTVGQNSGVRIGRTSFKLRNPENRPPDWAANFVADQVDHEVEVELKDDGLGVLLPIHLKMTCLMCHGPDKQLMPDLKAAIVSNYPEDQATGFSEGDLRGYFWIEVPRQEN